VVINDFDGDLKIRLDRSGHMGSIIYWRGFFSLGITRLLDRILRPDMTFLDVGANQGEIALFAAKRLPAGRVIAFEPVSDLNSTLAENVELNGFENVTICEFGLSDEAATAQIFTSNGVTVDGSRFNEGLGSIFAGELRSVPMGSIKLEKLDDVFGSLGAGRLDVIKIDTEGAELCVLRGGEETLRNHRPQLIVELNDPALRDAGSSSGDLLGFLEAMGYRSRLIQDDGSTRELDPSSPPLQGDVLAVPENGGPGDS
jgi:FkbM family methyltransferase